jgi:hypothetical protein
MPPKTSCKGLFADDIVGIIGKIENEVPMGATASEPARRGRPPLNAGEAKRASFNTRLRTALKERLEESARAAGRSLSEEIESRLERSLDRAESLGGREYEALFQMMAAAATVIEARLGNSPFENPEASAVTRNAWRQLIHSVTFDPLQADILIEQDRIINEMTSLKPPSLPSRESMSLAVQYDEWACEQEQYEKKLNLYEHQMQKYQHTLYELYQKNLKLFEVASEAAKSALPFPRHR